MADGQLTLNIEGMHCDNCARKVAAALKAIPGVTDAQVNLPEKAARVSVTDPAPSTRDLMNAVKSAGFTATGFSRAG